MNKGNSQEFIASNQIPSIRMVEQLSNFNFQLECKRCKEKLNNPDLSSITNHSFRCLKNYNLLDVQNDLKSKNECLKNLEAIDNQHNSSQIVNSQLLTKNVLKDSKICDSSKKLFQSSIQQFFEQHIKHEQINATHIIEYLKIKNKSLNLFNALMIVKNYYSISFTQKELKDIKKIKKQAKLSQKQNVHLSWDTELIQAFLDDLIERGKDLMAFRIFILYNTSARISELSQMSFGQILKGLIQYVPKKQIRCGKKAERYFPLDLNAIQVTQSFMQNYKITDDQTLDLGISGSKISSHSMINELKKIKTKIYSEKESQIPQEHAYLQFLKQFKFHDLRHTSIQEIQRSGVQIDKLRHYLGHSSIKTTELYLKNYNQICDVKCILSDPDFQANQSKFKQLRLQFQGKHE